MSRARLDALIQRLGLRTQQELGPTSDAGVDDPTLVDLTELPFVTIDNHDSRDLDQALFLEAIPGGFAVRYALADASHFVPASSALFEEALRRGASYYFPGFALPMLPRPLSEGIVSLNPQELRRAVVFETLLGEDAEVRSTRVMRARIRSRAKLSYDGVQQWFDRGAHGDEAWSASLRLLREVGELRIARARRRGVIEFDRTEAAVALEGERFVVHRRLRNDVERWNEQLSLLCNTEGARILSELHTDMRDLQSVYRVHLPPLASRLAELRRELDELCARHGLDDGWRWDGEQPLADYLAGLPPEPWRVRRAIELQVRYTNRASEYSDRVGPHFALAVEHYARFSAPMREIVGIFTHKEALEALGLAPATDHGDDAELRARVITAGNDARAMQKRIDNEVMLFAMSDLLAEDLAVDLAARRWRTATVIGLRPSRVYAQLDEVPLDVKIYTENLEAQFGGTYTLRGHALRSEAVAAPSFGLGDAVSLRVTSYDAARRRFAFDVRR